MADLTQAIFKRIVLHNKLLTEPEVDRLLSETPDPDIVVARMVEMNRLSPNKATQLLTLFRAQLDKHAGDSNKVRVTQESGRLSTGSSSIVLGKVAKDPPQPAHTEKPIDNVVDEVMGLTTTAPVAKSPGPNSPQPAAAPSASATATAPAAPPNSTAPQPHTNGNGNGSATIPQSRVAAPAAVAPPAPVAVAPAAAPQVATPTLTPTPAAAVPPTPVAPAPAPAPSQPRVLSSAPDLEAQEQMLTLLRLARDARASDLHIKAEMQPVARVCSILTNLDMPRMSADATERMLLSILDDPQRNTFLETRDLDFCYDGGADLGRFRTNYLRQHRGMDGVFHFIPDKVPSFQDLKLPDQVRKFTDYRVGIVLVTGPKGCGKTTTMAAMIDLINSNRREHIITIEDPIEFVQPSKMGHVNQRHVGPHTKSFSNALRAALREAPDVIMVGEMRDLETTSLAITAAETGHLVLATLHTPSAVRTLGRVLDVFPAKEQGQIRAMLSESLRGIISQFLIPDKDGKSMHLAMEIMVNTPAIGNLIREDRTFQLRGMMQMGKKLGMMIMDESLVELVKQGHISKAEALVRAEERAQMEKELMAFSD